MNLIKKRALAAVAPLVLVSSAAHAQSPAPAFEVVDIKPSAPSGSTPVFEIIAGICGPTMPLPFETTNHPQIPPTRHPASS